MYDKFVEYLKAYKKKTIKLSELEKLPDGSMNYENFEESIKKLVEDDILIEKGGKINSLVLNYGVNHYELQKAKIDEINNYILKFSKEIDLGEYFKLSEEIFHKDLPFIQIVNDYILSNGFPDNYVTSQERSFNISGDEKWIDEKNGKKLLERIKIWDKLKIVNDSDPLMLAVNQKGFEKSVHYHLIVENKATFLALMDILRETNYTTLIYGCGWKIISNYYMIDKQLNLKDKNEFIYFGDMDKEGISIWNSLNEKMKVNIAVDFYKALLKKTYSIGKKNQKRNDDAINNFLSFFTEHEKEVLLNMINDGGYLPQEGLNKEELKRIWSGMCED
ncbi:Wadjet anti-phage system protein JetD domain-containing protein [Clostridium beijerinckii]|uniref:Wadjet anti-phage system protein JetD domain-containing protein n=1 Tax=Clostridium beijerinckii TaxID=1520 RepID=UPI00232CE704|nr:Wadjet anti-phage system protein JetD domain-containing protein [Clostridium beijerinckii]